MNNINNNIYRIDMFMKYIKSNTTEHSEIAKESKDLLDIENSILLLEDYAEVLNQLTEVIDKYAEKTGYEG